MVINGKTIINTIPERIVIQNTKYIILSTLNILEKTRFIVKFFKVLFTL